MADDDSYIPFDFGTWRDTRGMECLRHGRQDGGLVITSTPRRGRGEVITRRFCGLCVLTALVDACGTLDSPHA